MIALKWAVGWLGRKRWILIAAILTGISSMVLMAIEPFLFRVIIDDAIVGGNYDILFPMLLRVLAVAAGYLCLRYVTNILCETASQCVVVNLRRELFGKILHQTALFHRENAVGDLITLCTGDTDMVRHFVCWVIPRSIECSGMLAGALVIFMLINIKYALCLFILTPISALIAYRLGKTILPAHTRVREQRERLSTVVNENISGNRVIKAFAREPFEIDKFEKANDAFKDAQVDANYIWLKYQPYMEFIAGALGVVNLIVGAFLVIRGEITLGQMNIFFSLAWALNEPMLTLGTIINDAQRFASSAEKLMSLQYSRVDIESPASPGAASERRGKIEIRNATLRAGGATLLEDIDFTAMPGQTIGIMGPTGSGKTVLAGLIPRLMDVSEGEVLIDGINVKDYDLTELRREIGVATQDVFMFSDTVENNVAYGNPEAPLSDVENAVDTADAAGFVRKLTQGYDTIVGERGTGLSGGQKQRLSLARALLPKPSILILDDTVSAVDMETEKEIQRKLAELGTHETRIVIAQRVSLVRNADCIYILENGRITEKGTHEELLKLGGYYCQTHSLQQPGEVC